MGYSTKELLALRNAKTVEEMRNITDELSDLHYGEVADGLRDEGLFSNNNDDNDNNYNKQEE